MLHVRRQSQTNQEDTFGAKPGLSVQDPKKASQNHSQPLMAPSVEIAAVGGCFGSPTAAIATPKLALVKTHTVKIEAVNQVLMSSLSLVCHDLSR